MALHLVQRRAGWAPCAAVRRDGDVVVLLGEGVAAVLDGASGCRASAADLAERGLEARGAEPIDDAEIVELCAAHAPIVTWTRP